MLSACTHAHRRDTCPAAELRPVSQQQVCKAGLVGANCKVRSVPSVHGTVDYIVHGTLSDQTKGVRTLRTQNISAAVAPTLSRSVFHIGYYEMK